MDVIKWFGGQVTRCALKNPEGARRLLLAGYRANRFTFGLPFSAKGRTSAQRLAASSVISVTIEALAHPERAALVSIFTPSELLLAAGITPYSLETISGYLMGTKCEIRFQEIAVEQGASDTLCSFHRTFLGAAENGLVPIPRFVIYTSLACDGNMITFPYVQQKFHVPEFFIDVPYEKSEDSVREVERQLREMKVFLEDMTGKHIADDTLRTVAYCSRLSAEKYLECLKARAERRLPADMTGEMYGVIMSRMLLGSEESVAYFTRLAQETEQAPLSTAKRLVWIHVLPYMQPSLQRLLNFQNQVVITGCDLGYDAMLLPLEEDQPYRSMARRLVYSGYNGDPQGRIQNALKVAKLTRADGAVIFAHWGCKPTLGAARLMKDALEGEGLPTLVLDGDACCPANSGDGQIATRMEAFLEILEERR